VRAACELFGAIGSAQQGFDAASRGVLVQGNELDAALDEHSLSLELRRQ
jgi:hypothetical protein